MKTTKIIQCVDSVTGIFTGIYDAWTMKYGHDYIKLEVLSTSEISNIELFSEYSTVEPNEEKAIKVATSIRNKISEYAYEVVIRVLLSNDQRKANTIYHFLVRGFAFGKSVMDHLADPYVMQMFEINRYVGNEVHFFKGFLRFSELANGVLIGKIEPKSNIVELLMPHFVERFQNENFMIVDMNRSIAGIHEKGKDWFVLTLEEQQMNAIINDLKEDSEYTVLWKAFFKSVSIKERENYNLQRNNVRLHYRKHMIEFDHEKETE